VEAKKAFLKKYAQLGDIVRSLDNARVVGDRNVPAKYKVKYLEALLKDLEGMDVETEYLEGLLGLSLKELIRMLKDGSLWKV
jgi:hypothetical protein